MNAPSLAFEDDLPFLPRAAPESTHGSSTYSVTASHLLSTVLRQRPLTSGCGTFDRLLGGGLVPGQTLECAGPPGIGKTKLAVGFALRAVADSLRPSASEELEALFIDTEGSADWTLFRSSAASLCHADAATIKAICDRVHVVRITATASFAMFLRQLPDWLHSHPRARFVVIDTMSALLRPVSLEKAERGHVMSLAKRAIRMSTSLHNCAVLVTSQMSTKLFSADTGAPADFSSGNLAFLSTPGQGGELGSWMPQREAIRRVSLFFTSDGERRAMVIAGPSNVGQVVAFALDDVGVKPDDEDMNGI